VRRADRLFQIIQILRCSTRPATAAAIAAELEVSKRTVYRDMADLIGQRVPIEGEAGFGNVLGSGYDMPPLMLTPDEIEAVVLGAQSVAGRADKALAKAAGANRMLVPFGRLHAVRRRRADKHSGARGFRQRSAGQRASPLVQLGAANFAGKPGRPVPRFA
jgi:predicted DNA-binding transcriptional regulator YafY